MIYSLQWNKAQLTPFCEITQFTEGLDNAFWVIAEMALQLQTTDFSQQHQQLLPCCRSLYGL